MSFESNKLCEKFDSEIFLYIGSELTARQTDEWKSHLESCQECSKKIKDINFSLSCYDQVPLDDVDDFSFERILRKTRFFSFRFESVWRAVALSVAAVLIITSSLMLKDSPPSVDITWSVDQTEINIEEIDRMLNEWTENNRTDAGFLIETRNELDTEIESIERDIAALEMSLEWL